MNFFSKKKYTSLKNSCNSKNNDNKIKKKIFYVYTTGLLNFDNLDDKSMIYLKWKNYFQQIVKVIPINYKIKIIHYDIKLKNNISAVDDDNLNKILLDEVLKYMNNHGNFVFNYFDPERLDIEIRFENMIIDFLKDIKDNHIIYDFSNILNSDIFCNITDYNIINPEYLNLIENNIKIDDVILFQYDNNVISYMNKITKIYGNKIKNLNDVINIYQKKWSDCKKIFWKNNKAITRLHNFGKLSEINWKKILIEKLLSVIWIDNISEEKINNIMTDIFMHKINKEIYQK